MFFLLQKINSALKMNEATGKKVGFFFKKNTCHYSFSVTDRSSVTYCQFSLSLSDSSFAAANEDSVIIL